MTSTPAASSSSAILGVIPSPPATFSPLTTTNVGRVALAQPGEQTEERPPPEAADEVADEEDGRGRVGHGAYSRARGDERTDGHTTTCPGAAAGRRDAARPAAAPPRRRAALDPARRRPPRRLRALRDRPCRRPGPAAVPHRGDHRADPQPARLDCAARAGPARAGDPRRLRRVLRDARARRRRCSPTRSPSSSRRSATTCRRSSRSANGRLDDVQDYFDRKNINIEVKAQGQTALQTLQTARRRRHRPGRLVRHGPRDPPRDGRLRRDPRLRPVGLHAHLRRADRRPRARSVMPPGDGTRDDDFPHRVSRAVARLRPRPAAVQRGDGRGRGHRPVPARRARRSSPTARRTPSASAPSSGSWSSSRTSARSSAPRRPCSSRCSRTRSRRVWVSLLFVAPAADRGPRRRAARLRPRAAHQPAARDLRAAVRRRAVRDPRRAARAADGGGAARDGRLPARAHASSSRGGRRARSRSSARRTGARRRRAARECGAASAPRDAYCRRCGADLYADAAARRREAR